MENTELDKATDAILSGKNCLILGGGGSGKSTLIHRLREFFSGEVIILAPTGIAAINVGGQTLHTGMAMPVSVTYNHKDIRNLKRNREKFGVNSATNLLIIDEISMCNSAQMFFIDETLKKIRKSKEPFGGLQVCMFGDFYQLGTVVKKEDKREYFKQHGFPEPFYYGKWDSLGINVFTLNKIYRQKDSQFSDILDRVRRGETTQSDLDILNQRVEKNLGNVSTICVTNKKAAAINKDSLAKLDGVAKLYKGKASGNFKERPVPVDLYLKVGARIMVCKNMPDPKSETGGMIVNGDIGTVVRMNKDSIFVDIDRIGERSISKVTYCKTEVVPSFDKDGKPVNKEVIVGRYSQIPVKLAYGNTVHKMQGVTLDKAHIDFEWDAFAEGMVYVALSRLTSLEGLTLERPIRMRDIKVNPRVKEFMESL